MSLSKKHLIAIGLGTSALVSCQLIASPVLEQIKAYLKPSIQYTLDDTSILEDSQTLVYNNKTYISVADLAHALGLEVSYENNTVKLISSSEVITVTPSEEEAVETSEALELLQATIKEVIPESNQVVILPADQEDTYTSYLVLNLDDSTIISGEASSIDDLVADMVVNVSYSPALTRSIPPQTEAYAITALTTEEDEDVMLKDMAIVEMHPDENYFIVATEGCDLQDPMNQTIIRYNEETKLLGSSSLINELKAGQKVSVKVAPAMTLSLPPQAFAYEITLQ